MRDLDYGSFSNQFLIKYELIFT